MTEKAEPFLPQTQTPSQENNVANDHNNVRNGKQQTTNSEDRDSKIWDSQMTRSFLKCQIISIIIILWLAISIYGCHFPVKTALNQILIFIYFITIYSVGLIFGYYVLKCPSFCAIRIFMLLELVTITASGILEAISIKALSEHAELDQNPFTRIWAANMYSGIILGNTLILFTSIGLLVIGFANSGLCWRKRKIGKGSLRRQCSGDGNHTLDEASTCFPQKVEENGV